MTETMYLAAAIAKKDDSEHCELTRDRINRG